VDKNVFGINFISFRVGGFVTCSSVNRFHLLLLILLGFREMEVSQTIPEGFNMNNIRQLPDE